MATVKMEKTLKEVNGLISHIIKMPETKMWIDYDKEADVLYLSFKRPQHAGIKNRFPFGTSWSLLLESDAMWGIYSQEKMGVQIQSSVEKLESALSRVEFPKEYLVIEGYFDIKYVIGKVDYNLADNLNDLEHFLIKKEAFKHEEEIRGLVKFSVTDDRQRFANVDLQLNIKINTFFRGGIYPPWMRLQGEEVKIKNNY